MQPMHSHLKAIENGKLQRTKYNVLQSLFPFHLEICLHNLPDIVFSICNFILEI